MGKIICLAQSKGGTSKTSSTLNLAAYFAKVGKKVLVVDLDQQCSLSISLGVNPLTTPGTTFSLLVDRESRAEDAIVRTAEGIDLIPASLDLALTEMSLRDSVSRERILGKKLRPIKDRYDFIILDTPPSFAITTLNGMAASDYLLIPVQPEPLCLYGLQQLNRNYTIIKEDANPGLQILGVFLALYDSRLTAHRELEQQIREDWQGLAFNTVIRRRSNILQATVEERSVVTSQPNSDLAHDYIELGKEILTRVC